MTQCRCVREEDIRAKAAVPRRAAEHRANHAKAAHWSECAANRGNGRAIQRRHEEPPTNSIRAVSEDLRKNGPACQAAPARLVDGASNHLSRKADNPDIAALYSLEGLVLKIRPLLATSSRDGETPLPSLLEHSDRVALSGPLRIKHLNARETAMPRPGVGPALWRATAATVTPIIRLAMLPPTANGERIPPQRNENHERQYERAANSPHPPGSRAHGPPLPRALRLVLLATKELAHPEPLQRSHREGAPSSTLPCPCKWRSARV